jgi:serine/threonine-protein kinase
VAVKQIHQQFLSDPRQLERYWREAQILASLQHPNILTIYDVVRPRGWLILELMRGNLQTMTHGEPIDLDYLRTVLFGALEALQFLHSNGILHGDVKPTNLLVDARNRIKLGDFGLARRASSQEGSLLKGTTKYMAPELVSNQFGPCGPASDLYSLGFSAYELMCGSQFESLFPGLATFGRDRQIAWLMWHAAPTATCRRSSGYWRVCRRTWPSSSRGWWSRIPPGASPRPKTPCNTCDPQAAGRSPLRPRSPPAPRRPPTRSG